MSDNNTTPAMKEVESQLLITAKDLAAQKHEYADWYQIECLEVEWYEKDAIRAMLLDDVAVIYGELKAAQWRTDNPAPPAQPLEGVKTAEGISSFIWHSANIEDVDKGTALIEAYHAQFATDAGGGNKQLLTDCQEMLMNLIALNHVPDEVCPDMNDMISRIDDAISAPSTHSSSEINNLNKE